MSKTVSGKSNWWMLVCMGIGLGLMIFGGMVLSGGSDETVMPVSGEAREILTGRSDSDTERESKVRAAQEALRKKIEKAQGNLEQRNQALLAAFLEKVRGDVTAQSAEVRAGIPGVVEHFGGFFFCMKLAYKIAKDAIFKDSQDTKEAVESVLSDAYLKPMTQMQAKAGIDLAALQRELSLSVATYEQEVAEALKLSELPVKELSSDKAVLTSFANVGGIAIEEAITTAALAGGGAMELVFLKGTLVSLKTVFQFVVGKLTATASGAAITAAADGPLPFFDCAAAVMFTGGVCLAADDIYDLKKELPETMTRELTEAVAVHETDVLKNSEDTARAWFRQIEECSQVQTKQLCASLND